MSIDFGKIIKRTWEVTWKYKILWVFGFFLGGSGANFNLNLPSFSETKVKKTVPPNEIIKLIREFLINYLAIVLIVGFILFLFFLLFLIARYLSKPALIGLVNQAEVEKPTLKKGLETGWHFLIRYILLGWLLWFPLVLLFAPVIILFIYHIYLFTLKPTNPLKLLSSLLPLLGFALLFLPIIIPLSVFTELAYRELVTKDKKVIESIKSTWTLFKSNLLNLFILWLIGLVIGIVLGFLLIIAIVFFILLAIPIVLLVGYSISIKSIPLIALGIFIASIGIFLLIVFSLIAQGFMGAFKCNYWTFCYLELTKPKEPPEPQPA